MMIAVQMDHKREFDALWNWSNTYMLITDPHNPNVGYFAWSMNTDGTPRSTGPAPDGEEYYVMALYFAANRWGNGQGIYNYKEQADKVLRGMRHHPVLTETGPFKIHPEDQPFQYTPITSPNTTEREQAQHNLAIELKGEGKTPPPDPFARFRQGNQGPQRPTSAGPMIDEIYTMIRFVPDVAPTATPTPPITCPPSTNSGPAGVPKKTAPSGRKAADVSRELFVKVTGPDTGLTPDRSNFDMSTITGRDGQPTPFSYDSWRSVSNWAADYNWWHKDPREVILSDRIQKFLISQGISLFADRYNPRRQASLHPPLRRHARGSHCRQPRRNSRPQRKSFRRRALAHPSPRRRPTLLRQHALHVQHAPRQRQLPHLAPDEPKPVARPGGHAPSYRAAVTWSSSKLSSSTFTRDSPRNRAADPQYVAQLTSAQRPPAGDAPAPPVPPETPQRPE